MSHDAKNVQGHLSTGTVIQNTLLMAADPMSPFVGGNAVDSDANQPLAAEPKETHRHADGEIHSQSQSLLAGRVVVLNGFPGVGKFSMGRRLFDMFDPKQARFIDNHLLIDPVQAIIPGRSTDQKALRYAFRKVAFDALSGIADERTTLIFTSCLSSSEEDQQVFEEYLAIASRRQISLYLFNIAGDRKEHHSRLVTTERSAGSKTKLTIPEILDDMLDNHTLVEIEQYKTRLPDSPVQYSFELDTTNNSVEESAAEIYRIITAYKH